MAPDRAGGRFFPRGTAYNAAAEGLARLLLDQIEGQGLGGVGREPLTYGQKLALVEDALYAYFVAASVLNSTEMIEVPTPRREIPAAARAAILERDGHKCLACSSSDDLTIDHIIPLEVGGAHALDNFQTLCRRCNSAKGINAVDYRLDASG